MLKESKQTIPKKLLKPFHPRLQKGIDRKKFGLTREPNLLEPLKCFVLLRAYKFTRPPIAFKFTASLEKLTSTDCVDFGTSQDRFERFSWTKNDSIYLDNKLKVFKGEDKNTEFRLRQNFTMGEAEFNQFIRQKIQLVVAADNSEINIWRQYFNLHF